MNNKTKNGKIVYLEILRTVALFFVLYAHSGDRGLMLYANTAAPVLRFVGILLASFCELSVPVFFMISGALLLKKEESLGRIWLHRVLPMSIITVLFAVFQYVYLCIRHGVVFEAKQAFFFAYGGGSITQQWFLYAYLSFLILLPFLQRLAAKMKEEKWFYYLLGAKVFVSTLQLLLTSLFDMPAAGITIPFAETVIFYPLIGFYLANVLPDPEGKSRKCYFTAEILVPVVLIINTLMNLHSFGVDGSLAYSEWFLYVYAIGLFVFIRRIGNAKKSAPFWIFCGSGVFGTYLFETQLKDLVRLIPLGNPAGVTAGWLIEVGSILLVMALGFAVMFVVKKIPFVGKYL